MRRVAVLIIALLCASARGGPGEAEAAGRSDLRIPDSVWEQLAGPTGRLVGPGLALGFSGDEMLPYSGSRYVLPTVRGLFRDVRSVPRYTGRLSDRLIAAADDPAELVRIGFRALGTSAARGVKSHPDRAWGNDAVPPDAEPSEALRIAFELLGVEPPGYDYLIALDPEYARFVARLLLGYVEAAPWFGPARVSGGGKEILNLALAPFQDEAEPGDVLGGLDMFEWTDHGFLALGSVLFCQRLKDALADLRAAEVVYPADTLRMETPYGPLILGGTGDDTHPPEAFLVVDGGGQDVYDNTAGMGPPPGAALACIVDIAGDDVYPGGAAHGIGGLSVVADLEGNDRYQHWTSVAWHGVGVLMDLAGDDVYESRTHYSQGCAHDGVALLVDHSGDDSYACLGKGQGYGGPRGFGLLLDLDGDDSYLAMGNFSEAFQAEVSLAQGVGTGRRADDGDGRSLAGGIGGLVDVAGNDKYSAQVYAQGAGYWWGLGFLEDRAGDDEYESKWYSLGSAPHFAIGSCVDLTGNDRYNVGEAETRCQFQGCARDGAMAVFIDGAGDDEYGFRNRCAGSADLNSIALFWDRMGTDVYHVRTDGAYPADPSSGGAVRYPEPFLGFRDDLPSIGLFLDSGGEDEYRRTTGEGQEPDALAPFGAGNDRAWTHQGGPLLWGLGLDLSDE